MCNVRPSVALVRNKEEVDTNIEARAVAGSVGGAEPMTARSQHMLKGGRVNSQA